jgi:hypothetical protein
VATFGDSLDPINHREDSHEGQRSADRIQATRVRITVFGEEPGPHGSNSSMTGTFRRNTDPHQKCSRSNPPNKGPSAPPAEKLAIHGNRTLVWVEKHVADE